MYPFFFFFSSTDNKSHAVFSGKVWLPWKPAELPTIFTGFLTPGELQASKSAWAQLRASETDDQRLLCPDGLPRL